MQAPELYAILEQNKLVIRPFPNKKKDKKEETELRTGIDNTDAADKMWQNSLLYCAKIS